MTDTRFTVNHAHLVTDKPFEDVTATFQRQLGRFDPDVYKALAEGGDAKGAKAKLEAMAGPSGFMLFATHNHGALLRLAGQQRKAIQYVLFCQFSSRIEPFYSRPPARFPVAG
jgi:hypothetical protein